MSTHLARVTQEPGVVREIDDAELLDLARQGILHSVQRTAEAKAVLAGVDLDGLAQWKGADKSDIVTAAPAITEPKEA